MKGRAKKILLGLSVLPALSACGYNAYMDGAVAHSQAEAERATASSQVALKMVEAITAQRSTNSPAATATVIMERTYDGPDGKPITEKVFAPSSSGGEGAALQAMAQAQMLSNISPVIQEMLKQRDFNAKAPVTSGEVLLSGIGQIPAMAMAGAMYKLGAVGLKAAGDRITATATDGGNINTGTGPATGATTTATTTTTVPTAEPEAPKEGEASTSLETSTKSEVK